MDYDFMALFLNAYQITSQVMFPILVFILILLIRDLNRYGKVSEQIKLKLNNLSESIESTGFKKNANEKDFSYIERYLSKKKK